MVHVRTWLTLFLIGLCLTTGVVALNQRDILPVKITPLNVTGGIMPNTDFAYNFVFANTTSCVPNLNVSTVITTDNYGDGYADLDISTMVFTPSYVCEYRNGTLRKTHRTFNTTFETGLTEVTYQSTASGWTNTSTTTTTTLGVVLPSVNGMRVVQSGNVTDLQVAVGNCTRYCTVYVPNGTYVITSTLVVNGDTTLHLENNVNITPGVQGMVMLDMKERGKVVGGMWMADVTIGGNPFNGTIFLINSSNGAYTDSGTTFQDLRTRLPSQNGTNFRFLTESDGGAISRVKLLNVDTRYGQYGVLYDMYCTGGSTSCYISSVDFDNVNLNYAKYGFIHDYHGDWNSNRAMRNYYTNMMVHPNADGTSVTGVQTGEQASYWEIVVWDDADWTNTSFSLIGSAGGNEIHYGGAFNTIDDNTSGFITRGNNIFTRVEGGATAQYVQLSHLRTNRTEVLGYLNASDIKIGTTALCRSDGTNCPSSVGDNSSWNETKANTLYAPISVTGGNATWNETRGNAIYYLRTDGLLDNQTWNQTKATTLYAPISTVSDNQTWNETRANSLYDSITNPRGYYNTTTLPAYPTADNTSWNQTKANTLYAPISTVSDNTSWNETRADAKYYLLSNPQGYFNTSTAPATLDPLWNGNRTLVCYSNGTGCPASSGDNSSWNETKANTLYAPISTVSDNQTWNQTKATTLYAPISTVSDNQTWNETRANALYLTSYTETDPSYNRTFNHTWVLGLNYITDGNTNWDNSYGFITTSGELDRLWSGNRTLVCYSNGTGCPSSSGGGILNNTDAILTSVNITRTADALFKLNSSGYAFTIGMEDSGANLKFKDADGAVLLTLNKDSDSVAIKNGLSTASYSGTYALRVKAGDANPTANIFEVVTSSDALLFGVNGTGSVNITQPLYVQNKLVCLADGTNCPASSGDNSSWNETKANTLYAPISTVSDNQTWNQTGANLLYIRNNTIPTCTGTDKLTSAGNGEFTCAPDQTSVGGGDPNYGGGWTNTSGSGNISLVNTAVNVSANALFIDNTNGRVSVTGNLNATGALQALRLGIGRETTTTMVDIYNTTSGADLMVLRNNADAADLTFDTLNALNRVKGGAGDGLMFGTAGQDYLLYITSGGLVGIGNSAPREKLDVNGSVIINGTLNVTGRANFTGDVYVQGSPVCTSATGCGGTLTHWVNKTTVITQGNGTTLQNITGLEWVALANQNYSMDCTLYYDSNLTTNGLSLALDDYGGAVSTARWGASIFTVSTTTVNSGTIGALGTTKVTSTAVQTANSVYIAKMWATINNGASDVIITPQVSAEIASSRSTINLNSVCHVETI